MKLEIDTILVQDDEAFAVTVDERAVVLGIRAGSYFDFNRIGSEIWRMLAEPCRVGEIIEALLLSNDVDMEVIKQDVTIFLQTLIDKHLVRPIEPRR